MKLLAAAVAVLCLIGCGEDSSPAPPRLDDAPLSAQQRRATDRAVDDVRAYCRALARSLARGGPRPDQTTALKAAEWIALVARAKPDATYRGSQTARMLAGDLAEDLEGTNCSRALVAALASGL